MPAFERAYALGAQLIEFDVQQTADGHLVVIHDHTLDRTTSGRGPVSSHTLAELRQLDAGSWFGPAFAGTPIPTLAETLDWIRGRVFPILELKQRPASGLPCLIEPVAAALLWAWLLQPREGLVNMALRTVGISGPPWLASEQWVIPGLMLINIWSFEEGMVILLAGLNGVPADANTIHSLYPHYRDDRIVPGLHLHLPHDSRRSQ